MAIRKLSRFESGAEISFSYDLKKNTKAPFSSNVFSFSLDAWSSEVVFESPKSRNKSFDSWWSNPFSSWIIFHFKICIIAFIEIFIMIQTFKRVELNENYQLNKAL